jgi:hypothetical protein
MCCFCWLSQQSVGRWLRNRYRVIEADNVPEILPGAMCRGISATLEVAWYILPYVVKFRPADLRPVIS